MAKRVVLAYSGGLDTSVAVRWMIEERGVEVIALAADVGQGGPTRPRPSGQRALAAGAVEAIVVDCREEYANDFVAPALKANALYEGRYPLVSSLSRPVIVKHLVAAAREHGADAVAHGCTGKGNDQVRFEVSTRALAPDLEVLAPVREWGMTREDSIDYAARHDIPIRVTRASLYSIDENLWGRAIECGILEDPWEQPPEDVFAMTVPTATEPDELVVTFEAGVPVAVDGVRHAPARADPGGRRQWPAPTGGAGSTWSRTGGSASRAGRSTRPRAPWPSSWPTRTSRASPSSATWPTRRPAWSPAGPSWSTTACGSRPSSRPSTPSSTRASAT